jgi:hypothetical protein
MQTLEDKKIKVEVQLAHINRLTKDLKESSKLLTPAQARYLCDTYYQIQELRKATSNQTRALEKSEEPNLVTQYISDQMEILEKEIQKAMKAFAESHPVGVWAMKNIGIGPVFAAGLLAHIDPAHCQSGTHVFKYAGLAPGQKRVKGKKLDFNPDLKKLCWLIGESFMKVSGNPDALYGQIYKQRREYETKKNENLEYSDQANEQLKRVGKTTEAFKHLSVGKLPPGAILARSKRYAVKMFLSHFAQVMWETNFPEQPWGYPYAIDVLGHCDFIKMDHYEPLPRVRKAS